jgi:hypothetical protein
MTSTESAPPAVSPRKYVEAYSEVDGDDRMKATYFTYRIPAGLVAGVRMTVHFTVDGTPQEVWPFLSDFNAWQNSSGYYYSGVVGDLEGKPLRLADRPDDVDGPPQYVVAKVLPEYIIVLDQPVAEGSDVGGNWTIGQGGVSPGYHIIGLDDFGGKTYVTFHMEHASLMAPAETADSMSEEDAIAPWQGLVEAARQKWSEGFIPTLRNLVSESAAG